MFTIILVHLVVQRTGPTGAATKVRSVFDATRTGLNELLNDLPVTLPTIREILRDLQAGDFIAKADWTDRAQRRRTENESPRSNLPSR